MFASSARCWQCVGAVAIAIAVAGCSSSRDYIWAKDVPKTMYADPAGYRIETGDVIGVRVWNQDANSIDRVRVREDGKIFLPFLGDVDADGLEPAELARHLEVKLKAFINAPVVTVVLHERRPVRVSVLGRVAHPGVFDLDRGTGVLHALAAAGGLTPFAGDDGIYVIRAGYWADAPEPGRIRFSYRELREAKAPAALFRLRFGDVVVVE